MLLHWKLGLKHVTFRRIQTLCVRVSFRAPYYTGSCFLRHHPSCCDNSSGFCGLDEPDSIVDHPSRGVCLKFCLMISLGFWVFGGEDQKDSVSLICHVGLFWATAPCWLWLWSPGWGSLSDFPTGELPFMTPMLHSLEAILSSPCIG